MLRKLSIPILAAVLLIASIYPAFAQERSGNDIIDTIVPSADR